MTVAKFQVNTILQQQMWHINNVSSLTGQKTNGKSAKISLGIHRTYQYETFTPEQKPMKSYLHFSLSAIKTSLKKTQQNPLTILHTIQGLGSTEIRLISCTFVNMKFGLVLLKNYLLGAQKKTIISSRLRTGQMDQIKFTLG